MPLSIITATIPLRDPALAWDDLGPGLYPGEVAVLLTSGEKVAVSVDPTWLENGAGVSLEGNARWIDDAGQTKLDPQGKHVETNLTVTASMADVAAFPLNKLAKDVAVMLLGEGPRAVRPADPVNGLPERPVFDLDQNLLQGVSVKKTADTIKAMTGFRLALS